MMIAKLAVLCLYSASTMWWSLWLDTMQAGLNYLLPSTYGQGRALTHTTHLQGCVPLMPYTCMQGCVPLLPYSYRAVFPLCHTLAGPCSPHTTHLQSHVPLIPHTCRAVFSLRHTLAGLCSPLMPHTSRAVFPLPDARGGVVPICHSLAGPRSPLIPHTCRAVFPLCHSLAGLCLALYTTQSQGRAAHAAARTE